MSTHFDLAIIGTGSGQLASSTSGSRTGRVAILEKGTFGGTCLNVGCIPTKMFVYPADLALSASHGPGARRRDPLRRVRVGRRSATGSSGASTRSPIGGRDWRAEQPERHALRGARPLRRRTHPRHRAPARRSRPTRSWSRRARGRSLPDVEGLDEVGFHTSDTVMRARRAARAAADPRRRLRGRGVRARVRLVRQPT